MNKIRLLAACCAALTLVAAACGDDDDDDASPQTVAEAPTTTAPGVAGAPGTAAATGSAAAPDTAPTDNPELADDCQTLFTFATEDMGSSEALSLDVGDEINDDHRQQAEELIGQLEDLDLQTDEAQDARDTLIDVANEFRDADEVTEDLASDQFEEFESFTTTCLPYLSATAATGG